MFSKTALDQFFKDFDTSFPRVIGLDVFNRTFNDMVTLSSHEDSYPKYDVIKVGDDYSVELSVAGFTEADLEIRVHDKHLIVEGKKVAEDTKKVVTHRGIARRAFVTKFLLPDYGQVTEASLEYGILRIKVVRDVPEAMKPRIIKIGGG